MRALASFAMVAVGLGLSSSALAACPTPYTSDGLLEDLGNVETFMRNGDNDAAGAAAKGMESKIGCLNEVLPPIIVGRAYRAIAGGLYVAGELTRSKDWFASALVVDAGFEYGTEDLPASHPVLQVYAEARRMGWDDPLSVEGKKFVAGTHYLDGRKLSEPRANPGMPHLYQFDNAGAVSPYLIQGNAFPAEVLTSATVAAVTPDPKTKEPKTKEPKTSDPKVASTTEPKTKDPKVKEPKTGSTAVASTGTSEIKRKRPGEKTPLMIIGGVVMAGAGGVYALAAQSRGDFNDATTLEEVDSLKTKTNQMVVISGAVLAVGAGALTWGIVVGDTGAPIPTIRVRF